MEFYYSIVALIILAGYVYYLLRVSDKGFKSGFILVPGALILLVGIVIYYIGYYSGECVLDDLFTRFFRSLISSFELFISDTHLEEVHAANPEMLDNPGWMFSFMLCYTLALATGTFLIYEIIFTRQLGKRWLMNNRKKVESRRWFIFWGLNAQGLMLARDIRKECVKKKEKFQIVFIDSPSSRGMVKRLSFFELLFANGGQGSLRKQIKKEMKDARILMSKADLNAVVQSKENDCLDIIDLKNLKYWLQSKKTEVFILSDNADDNLKALLNLVEDNEYNYNAKFYCYAPRTDYNKRLELCLRANVSIIDTSNLAVQNLVKNHTELHPVNYVTIKHNKDVCNVHVPGVEGNIYLQDGIKMGCVESEFNSMVVGFGEIGKETLKFLYEFGAFSNGCGKRSDCKCYVTDKDMDFLAEDFMLRTPAARHNDLIVYEGDDVNNISFWDKLRKRIDKMNYIVVSLGEDKINMSIGLRILEFAKKHRKTLNNFVILVRNYNYDTESADMEKIYNENFAPNGVIVFKCFGKKQDIWKYDVISNTALYAAAGVYHENYRIAANDGYKPVTWEDLNSERQSVLYSGEIAEELRAEPNKMPLGLAMGDARKINQDYMNVLHAYTKRALCNMEIFSNDTILSRIPIVGGFPDDDNSREHYEIPEGLEKDELEREKLFKAILSNLADTEHIRWNASHEINGYTFGDKGDKNEMTCEHNDMVECSELKSGVTIHYDWIVVKQSMKMS